MLKKIFNLIRKLNKSSNIINDIDNLIAYKIKSNQLLESAFKNTDLITRPLEEDETELIVSFTTYDKRIHDVHLVIESIAQQTVKPHRLLLWLDEDEFTQDTIPLILHKQIERGLDIRFCPNYRSYKKLVPALQCFPNANIITIDDDILYPHDMIEMLVKEHAVYPKCILGHRAHKIKYDEKNKVLPYKQWEFETTDSSASDLIFLTGGAGALYPAQCFDDEVLNSDVFLSICPHADDMWFKVMALLNNVKCKKVNDVRGFSERFVGIKSSQDIALYNINLGESLNDIQLKSLVNKYSLRC